MVAVVFGIHNAGRKIAIVQEHYYSFQLQYLNLAGLFIHTVVCHRVRGVIMEHVSPNRISGSVGNLVNNIA